MKKFFRNIFYRWASTFLILCMLSLNATVVHATEETTGDDIYIEDTVEENNNTGELPEEEDDESEGDLEEAEEIPEETELMEEKLLLESGGEDAPTGMKINLLSEPYGVDKSSLSFSWINSSVEQMQEQQAYRIVISQRKNNVDSGEYVFDSGWKEDRQNTSVFYDLSDVLSDNEVYYWQVQIRGREGEESSLSEPQAFSTSVDQQWNSTKGIWSGSQKVVFFRKSVNCPENMEKAILSVSATSTEPSRQYVYNMYVNGEEVGVGPTRQNGSEIYYDTYDVTSYLETGDNVLGAICYSESSSGFLCQLTYYLADGSKVVETNSGSDYKSWRCMDGDAVYLGSNSSSIGTSYYTARQDNVNASLYPAGWDQNGYDEKNWKTPQQVSSFSGYSLVPSETENMKRYSVSPESVTYQNGTYLIDFGKEIIGSVQLNLNSSAAEVTLEYGEELDESGNAKYNLNTRNVYQEKWTLKDGNQVISGIGMKTFRYVTIRNLPASLTEENICGLTIRQEFHDEESDFTSSNSFLNDVYELSKYTSKINGQALYVDTQSRERKPYEGDALISALNSYSYGQAYASAKHSAEYLLTNTTWPAEYSLYNIMLVYENYMATGDVRDLAENYQLLKSKTLEQYYDASMGLMAKVEKSSVSDQKIMVDWPTTENDGYETGDVYYNTVFNAVCVGGYESMAGIADALGYADDVAYYQGLADTIRNQMIACLYNGETGEFIDGLDVNGQAVEHSAQHATAFALAYGIYDSQSMADSMVASIEADEEMKMSVYGTYFLLQGLYRSNHGNLARKIMSNAESTLGVRSWRYMMYGLGATTATEAWNSEIKSNMSLCHQWGAAPGAMLVRGMFGIQPTSPGYDTFDVKLQPGGVSSASVKVPTLKGEINVSYTLDGAGGISVNLKVPSNSTATVWIPDTNGQTTLTVNGQTVEGTVAEGYLCYTLSAGSYDLYAATGTYEDSSELLKTDVVYTAYRNQEWLEQATNGFSVGTENGEKLQALKVELRNQTVSGTVQYAAYMQSSGWQDWVENGAVSGATDTDKRMEAIKIQLTGELAEQYDVYYRVYVDGNGWLDWAVNGDPAGSSGKTKAIRIIQAKLVKKGEPAPGDTANAYLSSDKLLSYTTHVQSYGWQSEVSEGEVSGTVGKAKRLEGIKIKVKNTTLSGDIKYSTHVQSYGWQSWKSNGALSGTTGQAKRLEAIKIQLTGELAEKYDVYYRVHAQTFGWMGWAKNGEPAGTEGYARRLEAIQIVLVKKGNSAPGSTENAFEKSSVTYSTHVQSYGWMTYVNEGELSGTQGKAKRLEGIRIKNKETDISGSIQYRTHVQSYGWEKTWKSNGQISGTVGKSKRLEAIQIRLTGELAEKYDVYYRVHVQSYGWLDWAKNGEYAGTEGLSKRLEAIEICYVEKGKRAPGSTKTAYIKGE